MDKLGNRKADKGDFKMKFIDYLIELKVGKRITILKKMLDNPRSWFRMQDLVGVGYAYTDFKNNIINNWIKFGIVLERDYAWRTGRGKIKMTRGKKYKINVKNYLVKILNKKEVKK